MVGYKVIHKSVHLNACDWPMQCLAGGHHIAVKLELGSAFLRDDPVYFLLKANRHLCRFVFFHVGLNAALVLFFSFPSILCDSDFHFDNQSCT